MLNRPTLSGAIIRLVVLIAVGGWCVLHAAAVPAEPSRPIVAELVANPDAYVDSRIEIYGLVIESNIAARSFLLQDVSQRPLLVDAHRLPPVAEGDQVQIEGVLRRTPKGLVLVGDTFKRVKVLAGGGCC